MFQLALPISPSFKRRRYTSPDKYSKIHTIFKHPEAYTERNYFNIS